MKLHRFIYIESAESDSSLAFTSTVSHSTAANSTINGFRSMHTDCRLINRYARRVFRPMIAQIPRIRSPRSPIASEWNTWSSSIHVRELSHNLCARWMRIFRVFFFCVWIFECANANNDDNNESNCIVQLCKQLIESITRNSLFVRCTPLRFKWRKTMRSKQ